MKRQSLLNRAMLSTAAIGAIAFLALSTLFLFGFRSAFQTQFLLRAQEVTGFFAREAQYPLLVGDSAGLSKIAGTAFHAEDVVFVSVSGPAGDPPVEIYAGGTRAVPGNHAWADMVRNATAGKERILEVSRRIKAPTLTGMLDWNTTPAEGDLGMVRIGFSMRRQDELFRRVIVYDAEIAGLLLLFLLPWQRRELKRVLSPLEDLIRFTRKIGAGDLASRATFARRDEVGELTLSFNQMLDQLSSTTVSRNYVDGVLRCMGESLIVVDNDGNIRTVNAATVELLGYHPDELIGKPAALIHPRVDYAGHQGLIDAYRARDGRQLPVSFSAAPLRDSNGGREGTVWMAQDMTAVIRTQEELVVAREAAEEANRAKSLFLATMSHELRTPLNAILGFGQLLRLDLADAGLTRWNKDLDAIDRAGNHLRGLINDVLDLSKMDAGKMQLVNNTFDIVRLSRDVAEEMAPIAAENGNQLTVSAAIAPGAAEVCGDEMRVRQSLLNLLSNACKFTKDGRVAVDVATDVASAAGETVWFSIAVNDTGIGIRAEDMGRLFGDFIQVDASTTRKFGGTGLGLCISRRFCRMMGGDITAESVYGEGSTFTIRLPAVKPPA